MNCKKGPIIGRGSTATVSVATTVTRELIAIKSSTSQLILEKEQQILSKLTSPHVIEYIRFEVSYSNNIPMYNLLMEYAPRGTISYVMKKQSGGCYLDECLIQSYTHQILLGLDYIHSNNIVHCDIKCDNILVCDNNVVKIGDFGCAKLLETDGVMTSSLISGTPVFMAPEAARGEEQGFEADVWAVGCVVIEMATGRNPWPEIKDPVSGLYKIGYSGDVPLFPTWLSVEGKDFLNKCLQINANERWSVKELLKHPFVDSKSCFEKMETLSKKSPISVLDQGFWDNYEETESLPEIVSGVSPVDRVRQLVEASNSSCLPNWVDTDDWITVRINHIEASNLDVFVDVDDVTSESTHVSESTHFESLLFEHLNSADFLWYVRMMLGCEIVASSGATVAEIGSRGVLGRSLKRELGELGELSAVDF
ncbi:mitogen-activated protein kinase kinase kinase 18-like [Rutidosis leptorrhynchoides]|uniref:mitogen-activated protein kinase kinase kinase 18-like n=1 Tax=Rutidosis leptorrhynchoides TaxID=125765 RepID=UPI003A99457B